MGAGGYRTKIGVRLMPVEALGNQHAAADLDNLASCRCSWRLFTCGDQAPLSAPIVLLAPAFLAWAVYSIVGAALGNVVALRRSCGSCYRWSYLCLYHQTPGGTDSDS